MSKKMLIDYTIFHPDYSREWTEQRGVMTLKYCSTFETAKRMSTAFKIARRMGDGAEVTQVSETRTGKRKCRTWIYRSAK